MWAQLYIANIRQADCQTLLGIVTSLQSWSSSDPEKKRQADT